MGTVAQKLEELIAECESRASEKHREIRELDAELKGYKVAFEALERAGLTKRRQETETVNRPLSESWKQILSFVGQSGGLGTTIDEIEKFVADSRFTVSRNSVRSQLSIYNQKGILHRVGSGRYVLSPGGRIAVGVSNYAVESVSTEENKPVVKIVEIEQQNDSFEKRVPSAVGRIAPQSQVAPVAHRHGRPWDDDDEVPF